MCQDAHHETSLPATLAVHASATAPKRFASLIATFSSPALSRMLSGLCAFVPAAVLVRLLAGCFMLSAANVYARDTQHLLELVMLMWFWLTPIVYPFRLVASKLAPHGLA